MEGSPSGVVEDYSFGVTIIICFGGLSYWWDDYLTGVVEYYLSCVVENYPSDVLTSPKTPL